MSFYPFPQTRDRDYKDMVDPFIRIEEEAEQRGYREGLLAGLFYAFVAVIGLAMLLVSLHAHANVTWVQQTWAPIKASQCGGTISLCQNNSVAGKWTCYCVR